MELPPHGDKNYFSPPQAREAIDEARGQVAALVGGQPEEIIFTGTEANSFAIKGLAQAQQSKGKHSVVSAIEPIAEIAKVVKRTGALWLRRGTRITPYLDGGVKEAGRRAGTLL